MYVNLLLLSLSQSKFSLRQKMNFFINYFFSIYDQIRMKLRNWSYLLNKSLMENLIFCEVLGDFLSK